MLPALGDHLEFEMAQLCDLHMKDLGRGVDADPGQQDPVLWQQ